MPTHLLAWVLPAAYALLPSAMASAEASAMLLAIAMQESKCRYRRQLPRKSGGAFGPARGFWQFEEGGAVKGVQQHPKTRNLLEGALVALAYKSTLSSRELHQAIEHNDVLAAVMARLLLYTLPAKLPGRSDVDDGWRQYLLAWRPGEPHPKTWPGYFRGAWDLIEPIGGA